MADGDWRDIPTGNSQADLVIVPTIGAPIAQVLEANPRLVDWLGGFREAPTGQVRLASNCTGAFLLAEAFVIDAGRTSQAPYGALQARRYHSDAAVLKLQDWHPVFIGRDLGGNPSAFGPGYA
jgi:transcriptional regulator GlxA family with amidase domain